MHSWLCADAIEALGAGDLLVRDVFLSPEVGRQASEELSKWYADGALRPAGVGRNGLAEGSVRSDRIAWVEPERAEGALALVVSAFEELRSSLNERAWLGLGPMELQAACYPGGGVGYDWHRDAFRGPDNRRVTAICYLNPGWHPDHGGVLLAQTPRGQRRVEPMLGRLALFLSAEVEHRVLPSTGPRFAITAWYRGRSALPWT